MDKLLSYNCVAVHFPLKLDNEVQFNWCIIFWKKIDERHNLGLNRLSQINASPLVVFFLFVSFFRILPFRLGRESSA